MPVRLGRLREAGHRENEALKRRDNEKSNPVKSIDPARIGRLQAIAAMKRDAELAKLATVAQSRARLIQALDGLNQSETPLDEDSTPGLLAARLAHLRWIEGRRRMLNQRLALINADYLERRPAVLEAFGRAQVLEALAQREKARAKKARLIARY